MKAALVSIFGADAVSDDVDAHCGDMTENAPRRPSFVVKASDAAQVGELLKLCNEKRIPVTPKVTGQNVGTSSSAFSRVRAISSGRPSRAARSTSRSKSAGSL